MHSAEVSFSRFDTGVEIALSIDGAVVAASSSPESIIRELQIRGVRKLRLENSFVLDLPTSAKTLNLAMEFPFSESMAALKLIAACSDLGEVPTFPYPERRSRPKVEFASGPILP
ncbi:MAG: hypothetical protein K2X55_24095 [Burkholderiaceae bacterium]|nr:hypothetical protein [Burkholderiaceae bacterium]